MKILKSISLLTLLICSAIAYGQSNNSYTDQFINNAIVEVYQNQANKEVFQSANKRFEVITRFFKKQLSIEYLPKLKEKGYVSTNDLSLINKYNPNLHRDVSYNPATFNPLKYAIHINPLKTVAYRIANTDYIMIVTPFKN